MRKIKYLTSMIFIAIILTFIGDMYIWNIDSFETEYISTTMYLPEDNSQDEMLEDIQKKARKHNCLIFVVNRNIDTVHSETVSVYCMEGVEKCLQENSSIREGMYQSIFLGKVIVTMEKLENIPDVNEIDNYYLVGTMTNARAFKKEVIDTYDGNFPKEGYVYFNSIKNIICVWGVGIVFLLLMTLYETALLKKEMAVRFIYGERLRNIVLKRIVLDIIFCVGYSILIALILKYIFNLNIDYQINISGMCIAAYCVLNSLIYLRLLLIEYKSSLSRGKGNRTVLNISYIYKTVIIVVIALVASFCTEMIVEGINFWKQKDFFEEYSRYSYLSISSDDGSGETTEKMMLELINKKSNENKAFLNVYMDEGIFSGRPCLMCNKNTINYLKSEIGEIKDYKFDNCVYFIVPEEQQEMYEMDLEMLAKMYMGENIKYEVITYENNCSAIGIKSQNGINSRLYSNPLIILDAGADINYYNGIYFSQACMVDINEAEWKNYVNNAGVEKHTTYKTNVYDNYNYYLKKCQRTLLLGFVAFVILMIMELIIVKTMLQYECMINSIELAVKTVVGYSVFMKYRKMFTTTLVTLGISAFGGIIIARNLGLQSSQYLVIGYVVIGLIDIIMMFHYIKVIEKISLQKVLKGSVL